jgi:putative transposase
VHGLVVHAASVADGVGAKQVVARAGAPAARLQKGWCAGGYAGKLAEWAAEHTGFVLEVVGRPGSQGWHVLSKRWIVERTFAWLLKCRRLVRDYEYLPQSSESWIYLAMTQLMVRRLAP